MEIKNKKPFFSLILPIYNVEKYLDRCISSVLQQTYSDYEIILVDDGSPDNCPSMCDDWAKKDDRIKVIHKENGGLGYARNTGIENASGEYIFFIDSDDYIDSDLLFDVAKKIEKYGKVDILCYGHRKINTQNISYYEMCPNTPKEFYEGEEIQSFLLPEFLGKSPYIKEGYGINTLSAWVMAFRNETLIKNKFKFVSERDIISEDIYSIFDFFAEINTVVFLNKVYYNYCQNEGSLTKAYKPDRFEKIVDFYLKMEQICDKNNYSDEVRLRIIAPFITNTYDCIKSEIKYAKKRGYTNTYKRLKSIYKNEILQKALKKYPSRQYPIKRKIVQYCIKNRWIILTMIFVLVQMKIAEK